MRCGLLSSRPGVRVDRGQFANFSSPVHAQKSVADPSGRWWPTSARICVGKDICDAPATVAARPAWGPKHRSQESGGHPDICHRETSGRSFCAPQRVVRFLLSVIAAAFKPRMRLIAENLCLWQQLLVRLRMRPQPRPSATQTGGSGFPSADGLVVGTGWRSSLLIVEPETVLRLIGLDLKSHRQSIRLTQHSFSRLPSINFSRETTQRCALPPWCLLSDYFLLDLLTFRETVHDWPITNGALAVDAHENCKHRVQHFSSFPGIAHDPTHTGVGRKKRSVMRHAYKLMQSAQYRLRGDFAVGLSRSELKHRESAGACWPSDRCGRQ